MARYSLDDLTYLMARLRDADTGCPWDIKQDFASVVPHTLEEAYEVADAIAKQDWPHVEEELGDLLFQVIFYAQMGHEKSLFDFQSIVHEIVSKLLRRHPHVFPDGSLSSRRDVDYILTDEEIAANWDRIKQQEKAHKLAKQQAANANAESGQLAELPRYLPTTKKIVDIVQALPALTRAQKIQRQVSKVGFDWTDIEGVFAKVKEEVLEVEQELFASKIDPKALQHEIGDLLFSVVNLARHSSLDSEQCLQQANDRFIKRFDFVEHHLADQQLGFADQQAAPSQEQMEQAWQWAKSKTQ